MEFVEIFGVLLEEIVVPTDTLISEGEVTCKITEFKKANGDRVSMSVDQVSRMSTSENKYLVRVLKDWSQVCEWNWPMNEVTLFLTDIIDITILRQLFQEQRPANESVSFVLKHLSIRRVIVRHHEYQSQEWKVFHLYAFLDAGKKGFKSPG